MHFYIDFTLNIHLLDLHFLYLLLFIALIWF